MTADKTPETPRRRPRLRLRPPIHPWSPTRRRELRAVRAAGSTRFRSPAAARSYRSLNPTTKLVIALARRLIALSVRGWTAPLIVLAVSCRADRGRWPREAVPALSGRDLTVAHLDPAHQHVPLPRRHGHDLRARAVHGHRDRASSLPPRRHCESLPSPCRSRCSRSRLGPMSWSTTSSDAASAVEARSSSTPPSGRCRG